jgi:hypothetical protein
VAELTADQHHVEVVGDAQRLQLAALVHAFAVGNQSQPVIATQCPDRLAGFRIAGD